MTLQTIDEIARQRGISEVLHFTTNNGLIGILATRRLMAHSELPNENLLSHILQINCPDRSRDRDWHSYVNLSISRINGSFFAISKNKWHVNEDRFWCILSFSPEIMSHQGVYFATSNNAYDLTKRASGPDGFNALFQDSVRIFQNKWASRSKTTPPNHTTCYQAEVLYPTAVSLEHLQAVYVGSYDHLHEVEAQIGMCAPELSGIFPVIVDPDRFL